VYYERSRDDWQETEMAATVAKLITAEEMCALPDDGQRYEIVRGALTWHPMDGFEHGSVAGSVVAHLNTFVWQQQLGRVASGSAGYLLARAPDILLSPDVSFVAIDRLPPTAERTGFLHLAPDLVVEVMSPNDTVSEVAEKVSIYLQTGVRLVWVVLPKQRLVHVYANEHEIKILHVGDTLDGGDVLPGFRLAVADTFT
jgi:Uma2 family endonuclease